MLDFYNGLRSRLRMVEPNDAHRAIVDLEESGTFEVVVVTTNVDDLHERAGSTNVIHLHGELNKSRSTKDNSLIYECHGDINIGEKCEKGSQLRPHVIWFGENLDPNVLSSASAAGRSADYIVIVGTTMSVQPAASLPFLSHKSIPIFYVDPAEAGFTAFHRALKATVKILYRCCTGVGKMRSRPEWPRSPVGELRLVFAIAVVVIDTAWKLRADGPVSTT